MIRHERDWPGELVKRLRQQAEMHSGAMLCVNVRRPHGQIVSVSVSRAQVEMMPDDQLRALIIRLEGDVPHDRKLEWFTFKK